MSNQSLAILSLNQIKETLMGIKEDFAAFKLAVDTALTEIQTDIEQLKVLVEAAGNTPPEVAAQMAEITAKLEAVRNIYNPATPPEEPL